VAPQRSSIAQGPEAASAAYWIGSQATKFYVTPSGEVGSIGVWSMHVDYSRANEQDGIAVTFVSAGEHKVEGNPHEPLSDEARAEMQRSVDETYREFVAAVARGRNVTPAKVLADFGNGRMLTARAAVQAGMADAVKPFEAVLTEVAASKPRKRASGLTGMQARLQRKNKERRHRMSLEITEHTPDPAFLRNRLTEYLNGEE